MNNETKNPVDELMDRVTTLTLDKLMMLDALRAAEAELEQSDAAGAALVLKCVRDAIAKAEGRGE